MFFPLEAAVTFGPVEAALAACAITHGAALWTLNPKDFRDIPGLALV